MGCLQEGAPLKPRRGDAEHKPSAPPVDGRKVMGLPAAAVSGVSYCIASGSMVLLNKAALSSFDFDAPTCLLFFQCLTCALLVRLASLFGLVKLEPWSWKIARVRPPVSDRAVHGEVPCSCHGSSTMELISDP